MQNIRFLLQFSKNIYSWEKKRNVKVHTQLGSTVELVSKELNHLAAILHVYTHTGCLDPQKILSTIDTPPGGGSIVEIQEF